MEVVVCCMSCRFCVCFFFFKQKTAYEMRISDWSSDVCSSDLPRHLQHRQRPHETARRDQNQRSGEAGSNSTPALARRNPPGPDGWEGMNRHATDPATICLPKSKRADPLWKRAGTNRVRRGAVSELASPGAQRGTRPEGRRVGKEGDSTGRSGW